MGIRRSRTGQVFTVAVLVALTVLTLLPFYMTLLMSQKTNGEILNHFWAWPQAWHPEYYVEAFQFISGYLYNSVIIGGLTVLGVVWLSSLGGYVFARLNFGGKKTMFAFILALMMIPGIMTLIPAFVWYKEFPLVGGNDFLGRGGSGLISTWWVLLLPYIAGGQIFGIFLCRTFFENIPESLFEAARIDGASEWQSYWHIALPLSLPILATLAILSFVGVYNDYIWPLITIRDDELQTFSVGVTKFAADGNLEQGPTMAGYVLGSIPLILVFAAGMKYYIQGLTQGAVKG